MYSPTTRRRASTSTSCRRRRRCTTSSRPAWMRCPSRQGAWCRTRRCWGSRSPVRASRRWQRRPDRPTTSTICCRRWCAKRSSPSRPTPGPRSGGSTASSRRSFAPSPTTRSRVATARRAISRRYGSSRVSRTQTCSRPCWRATTWTRARRCPTSRTRRSSPPAPSSCSGWRVRGLATSARPTRGGATTRPPMPSPTPPPPPPPPAEGRRHYETAYALADTDTDKGRLAEGAAECAGHDAVADAMSLADGAREHYVRAGLLVDAARTVALWAYVQINAGSTEAPAQRLAARYEEVVELPGAERVASELALQMGRSLYMSGPPTAETLQWFDRSVTLAESIEDFPLLVRAMSSYGGALMLAGRPTMCLGVLQVALEVTRRLGLHQARVSPLNNLVAFLTPRDLAAARGYAEEAVPLMHRMGDRGIRAFLIPNNLFVLWLAGGWGAAPAFWRDVHEDEGETVLALAPLPSLPFIQPARGEPLNLPDLGGLVPGPDAPTLSCNHLLLTALELWQVGDASGAAAKAAEATDRYLHVVGLDDDFYSFWVAAVELCVEGGALADADRLVHLVADAPPGQQSSYLRAQLPRLQAEVAVASGADADIDIDIDALLTRAAESLRAFGTPFYVARTRLLHAEWLVAQGLAEQAQVFLDEAQRLFAELRARPWMDRALGVQTLAVT